ncbi:Copper transporter 6 [Linum grandiflorum]
MSPGGGDNNMNMNMSMDNNMNYVTMMHSSLFWGRDAIVLFPRWPDHSLPMYILACFFVFFMAASLELLVSLKLPSPRPVVEACVYGLRMAVAYLVMLSVMSFNVGIFLAAVLGHSVGMFAAKVGANRAAVMVDGDAKI